MKTKAIIYCKKKFLIIEMHKNDIIMYSILKIFNRISDNYIGGQILQNKLKIHQKSNTISKPK